MKITILIACHKPDIVYKDDIYTPIHVGKTLSNYSLNMITDNTGNNISEKNPTYCEMTALYWAWKNLKNIDYIGLCHYRRYFDFHRQGYWYLPITTMKPEKLLNFNFNIPQKIVNKLSKGEIILPKKVTLRESLFTHYCLSHISDDIKILRDIITEQKDIKYIKAFNKIMLRNSFAPCNMFIMPWKDFDKYCTWLFHILNEVEKRIDTSHYNNRQKRVYGYMAERLLNIYIEANKKKINSYPIIQFSSDPKFKNPSLTRFTIQYVVKKISHVFSLPPSYFYE